MGAEAPDAGDDEGGGGGNFPCHAPERAPIDGLGVAETIDGGLAEGAFDAMGRPEDEREKIESPCFATDDFEFVFTGNAVFGNDLENGEGRLE